MYPGQAYVQLLLVLVMLVCVPWMLLPKPLILKKRHEARLAAGYAELNDDDDADNSAHPPQCQILPLPISRYRFKFQSNFVWDSIKSISNFCFQFYRNS